MAGAFTAVPSIDLSLQWDRLRWVAPFLGGYGEWLFARGERARDGYFVRAIGGLSFPGPQGEFLVWVARDSGNGKGLLVNRREQRVSVGIRYAPFAR